MYRRPQGYVRKWNEPGAPLSFEGDTFTCEHCQRIVNVTPLESPANMGGVCLNCKSGTSLGLICKSCVRKRDKLGQGCIPFMKKVEEAEARHKVLMDYGLATSHAPRRLAQMGKV